jgi:hypothetical protein
MGQPRPQRSLPLWIGQEVQALSWTLNLINKFNNLAIYCAA